MAEPLSTILRTPIEEQQAMQDYVRQKLSNPAYAPDGVSLADLENNPDLGYAQRQAQDPEAVTGAVVKRYRLGKTGMKDAADYAQDLRTYSNPGIKTSEGMDWRHFRKEGFLTLAIVLAASVILSTSLPYLDPKAGLLIIALLALFLGWVP